MLYKYVRTINSKRNGPANMPNIFFFSIYYVYLKKTIYLTKKAKPIDSHTHTHTHAISLFWKKSNYL